jgi:hypothetical protein
MCKILFENADELDQLSYHIDLAGDVDGFN